MPFYYLNFVKLETSIIMIPNFKAHPWHGVSAGDDAPNVVTTFIEIVPADTIKYEVDKKSGYLKVDRPQKFSNIIPALLVLFLERIATKKLKN